MATRPSLCEATPSGVLPDSAPPACRAELEPELRQLCYAPESGADNAQSQCCLDLLCREVGGYEEVPLLEDVKLVRRLRARYGAPVIVPGAVITSSRRWDRMGFVATTLLNQAIMAAWAMGTPPDILASWYYGARQLSAHSRGK